MRCKLGEAGCVSSGGSIVRDFVVVMALVLLCGPRSSVSQFTDEYEPKQLNALQAIFSAWNRTPNIENNLAGWSTTQLFPCKQATNIDPANNYRGVQCLPRVNCVLNTTEDHSYCSAYVIGLTLNNAEIVGDIPPSIGDIDTLSTLEITGNPKLTGQLPSHIQDTVLYIFDVHDNDFYGNLPEMYRLVWPVKLDLSGNRFNGSFPRVQIERMNFLQTLNLGWNQFEGLIPKEVFLDLTQLDYLNLSHNLFSGSVPTLSTIPNLQVLDMSSNQFNGSLPDLTNISSLRSVNLSRNEFTGFFSLSSVFNSSFSNFLTTLDVSYNRLSGSLTNWDVSQFGSLKELYLDNNTIGGKLDLSQLIVHNLLQKKSNSTGSMKTLSLMNNNITNVLFAGIDVLDLSTTIRLQGNPYCSNTGDYSDEQRCVCQQICLLSPSAAKANRKVIIISIVASVSSVVLLLTIGCCTLFYRNKRYKRYLLLQVQQKFEEFDVKPTIFTYNELRTATRDFHPDMKLGQGSYGAVYKGIFPNGSVVAIKQLIAQSTQSSDDFLNEIVLITGMRHRNLVNLKGCCFRERQKLLVYEYVDNHDIDQVLLAGSNTMLVDWPARLKICLGVAHGLHYLHALAQPRVIHRDIKASNVLLDKNFEAKIADFGLALLFPDNQSHIMTVHVAGTKGYLAPEYALFGQLSDKVDVYSFGVLCLEVISGRRNIDEKLPTEEMYLSKWAWQQYDEGNLMQLVDSTLNLHDDQMPEVKRLINVALLCIQNNEEQRPTMARVVAMLQGDTESEVVVVKNDVENRYKDSESLLHAFGRVALHTVEEEGESSFVETPRRELDSSERNSVNDSMIELGHLRAR